MKTLIVIITLILSPALSAASTWHTGKIKWIYPIADGGVVIAFHVSSPSCTNSNAPKYHYLQVGMNGVTQDALKNMYSLAVSALGMDKPLT